MKKKKLYENVNILSLLKEIILNVSWINIIQSNYEKKIPENFDMSLKQNKNFKERTIQKI